MTVNVTDNPKMVGYDVVKDEATILREDSEWMKELIQNINRTKDRAIVRQAEHDFFDEMLQRYGGKVAGELVLKLWSHCAPKTID